MPITGQCACGRTRYAIDDGAAMDVANCHCRTCRRTTGGTYVTWATVPRSAFHWTGQPPASYRSNARTERLRCAECGAQLALLTAAEPDTLDVTVATFDQPDPHPPGRDIWLSRKLAWTPLDPRLPGEPEEVL